MKRILIIEDDQKLSDGIKLALRKDYACAQAFSLKSAREEFCVQQFDLILLDVNFADGSGMDYLVQIRKESVVPVILLTANSMEMDIVTGLEMGADDYITKPFSLMVLRARVDVQLRAEKSKAEVFRDGDFCFDFGKMEYLYQGRQIDLSKTEQRLLRCLVENKGRSVTRTGLTDAAWPGESEYVDEHALTVALNRLRRKLGGSPDQTDFIKTVYGIGYMWQGER